MAKLEVGMYIRTIYGEIFKIIDKRTYKTKEDQYYLDKYIDRNEDRACNDNIIYEDNLDEIKKASFNLIDLIEEDDLLEVEYCISRNTIQKEVLQVIMNCDNKLYIKLYTNRNIFLEDLGREKVIIKTFLTHEQYEKNCCKF